MTVEPFSCSAFKWWPGGLGKTANYAVVMCQLVTPDGISRGPHPFMVQLRDENTHEPLPGIQGDNRLELFLNVQYKINVGGARL